MVYPTPRSRNAATIPGDNPRFSSHMGSCTLKSAAAGSLALVLSRAGYQHRFAAYDAHSSVNGVRSEPFYLGPALP